MRPCRRRLLEGPLQRVWEPGGTDTLKVLLRLDTPVRRVTRYTYKTLYGVLPPSRPLAGVSFPRTSRPKRLGSIRRGLHEVSPSGARALGVRTSAIVPKPYVSITGFGGTCLTCLLPTTPDREPLVLL